MAMEAVAAGRHSLAKITQRSPFPLGSKKVYLPSFKVTLLHTPNLPPHYATFLVPLNLNKLDFRDYLLNAYSVRTISITSRIIPEPIVETGKPHITRPRVGQLFRPAPKKKMTVLMEEPFVWPRAPSEEELDETWSAGTFKAATEEQRAGQRKNDKGRRYVDTEERDKMREQARRLLEGAERWRPQGRGEGSWAVRTEGQ